MSLRAAAREFVERAVRAGIENAHCLPRLSPREIGMQLETMRRRQEEEAHRMDLQAWLVGRYVLTALHAPRRYPRRPDGIRQEKETMTDADMKHVFAAMASRREEKYGGC